MEIPRFRMFAGLNGSGKSTIKQQQTLPTFQKLAKLSPHTPKLRFPEFADNWEVKKLGEIAEISSGGTPSRAKKEYWNGNIPLVSTTLIDFNIIDKIEEQITEEGLKKSSTKLFPKGTLLMAMYGQGKTRGKIAILGIKASTNQACGAIMPNNSILNNIFLFQNLAKRYDEIRDLSNQGGQENLSGGIIKGLDISLPQLPEQTKIANFLTAIDEKIQALKQKKTLLEQYKKGVMQRIFLQEIRFSMIGEGGVAGVGDRGGRCGCDGRGGRGGCDGKELPTFERCDVSQVGNSNPYPNSKKMPIF